MTSGECNSSTCAVAKALKQRPTPSKGGLSWECGVASGGVATQETSTPCGGRRKVPFIGMVPLYSMIYVGFTNYIPLLEECFFCVHVSRENRFYDLYKFILFIGEK